jgi:GNAT superfamily N-acetyltransferase
VSVAPCVGVRPARRDDLQALARLAAAVATQPLLQRYGASEAGLFRELERIVKDRARPSGDSGPPAPSGAAESLLLAYGAAATAGDAESAAAELWGLARFCSRGQFGNGGYLRLLALRPGCEGRGIGTLLLRAVEEEVKQHSSALFLLTSDFNLGAQRFYARHGYLAAGTLPDFARPGITENIFWKRLR